MILCNVRICPCCIFDNHNRIGFAAIAVNYTSNQAVLLVNVPFIQNPQYNKSCKPDIYRNHISTFMVSIGIQTWNQMIQKHKCGRNSLLRALKMITATVIITNHCPQFYMACHYLLSTKIRTNGEGDNARRFLVYFIFVATTCI